MQLCARSFALDGCCRRWPLPSVRSSTSATCAITSRMSRRCALTDSFPKYACSVFLTSRWFSSLSLSSMMLKMRASMKANSGTNTTRYGVSSSTPLTPLSQAAGSIDRMGSLCGGTDTSTISSVGEMPGDSAAEATGADRIPRLMHCSNRPSLDCVIESVRYSCDAHGPGAICTTVGSVAVGTGVSPAFHPSCTWIDARSVDAR
mmetsp:Transcript_18612/g.55156  ORF Transcript_18612/g.55156 Transcript_18612/m.55156 type:complete len:204 (+) Transcript_18612:2310-2921(+)